MVKRANGRSYKKQLDGLRFISFLAVFFYHNNPNKFWFGSYGLPLFFVLSGFLITGILLENEGNSVPRRLFTFYVRRFLRIFPAYYLLLIVLLILGKLPFVRWNFFYLFNVKLFLLSLQNGLGPFLHHWQSSGVHFWTLCVEEQFYLLYPLILLLTPRIWRVRLLVAFLMASIACRMVLSRWLSASYFGVLLPVCGEYLLWGALVTYLSKKEMPARIRPSAILYGGLAMLVLLFLRGKPDMPAGTLPFRTANLPTLYGIGFSLLVWGLWAGEDSVLARFLSWKPIAYLGKISYGLYLVHLFTWELGSSLARTLPPLALLKPSLMRFLLTAALASLSWHLYESPINNLKKHFPYERSLRVTA